MGVLSAFLASGRAARPFQTSKISPSPDAVAMTLLMSLCPDMRVDPTPVRRCYRGGEA